MSRQNLRITPLRPGGEAAFSSELNRMLGQLTDLLARLEARDGHVATFTGHVDLGGNRLRNIGLPRDGSDAVTVTDARERALYETDEGVHVAEKPIHAKRGILAMDDRTDHPNRVVTVRRLTSRLGDGESSDHNARVAVRVDDVPIGMRRALNLKAGAGIILTGTDDGTDEEVEVEIVSTGGGGGGAPVVETFDGPLTDFVLAANPASEIVFVNGVALEPTVEYAVVADTVTPTRAIGTGEWAAVYYWTSGGPVFESFTGPASTLTLASPATMAIVEVNGIGLRLVASGAGAEDFELSGATVTLGRAIGASEVAWVYSWA